MSWDLIIGQQRVKMLLHSAIRRNHLAHAFLFFGPNGAGQDAMALELAKALNCSKYSEGACDTCNDCVKIEQLQHPNVQLIFPLPVGKGEGAGDSPLGKLSPAELDIVRAETSFKAANPYHNIFIPKATAVKVNSIRDIRKTASMSAFSEGKKVYVITQADKMNDEAANALLKTLEEPLEDTVIILTTANFDQLLSTIRSRCQCIRFDTLSEEDVKNGLIAQRGLESEKAEQVSQIAMGNFSEALTLGDADLTVYRDDVVDFLRTLLYRSREDLIKIIQTISDNADRKEIERSLIMLHAWFHDAMIACEGKDTRKYIKDNTALQKFIEVHSHIDYGRVHDVLSEAISYNNKNVYIPLILTVLSFQLRIIIFSSSQNGKIGP